MSSKNFKQRVQGKRNGAVAGGGAKQSALGSGERLEGHNNPASSPSKIPPVSTIELKVRRRVTGESRRTRTDTPVSYQPRTVQ
eukprot:scaffold78452_cov53-Prasinocladus_malaysianus.AAC.1